MDRRLLAEERLEVRVVRDRLRVERAEPLLQAERPCERLLHRHLLVEREADEQRERILRDERVRLVVVREVRRSARPWT